eukprot:snap_masked-scaffold566_size135349-processed-gene-0.4 protein:Tk08887 transcript:snap_masked-scaffold566_size135349-processed-gene-0.4-mRNA-1 annotation:"lysosomal alpha-glucosidase"
MDHPIPYCFYPPNYSSYQLVGLRQSSDTLVADYEITRSSPYPEDVKLIAVEIMYISDSVLQIKIKDGSQARYEVPSFLYPSDRLNERHFHVNHFDITFDSVNIGGFVFSDQFIQISTKLPSRLIYGLGEHEGSFLKSVDWSTFTMWNFDSPPGPSSTNLYGSHPFYLSVSDTGESHGVFLKNSNAMEVILQPAPALTFRTIGGILDFYIFNGPSPVEVIEQYASIIGKPALPPYWSLGYHQCKFGQLTLNQTKKILDQTLAAQIPIDTQWNDLDYMKDRNDFTLDDVNFKELPSFVDHLHEIGMHYVTIIDPGVSGSEPKGSYPPYDRGMELDIFMKNSSGLPFVGRVWNPQTTVWPDFLNPQTVGYWTEMLQRFHNKVPIDGAWIDMNEPSNFWSGQVDGCPGKNGHLNHPPYIPRHVSGNSLFYRNICPSALHINGSKHYDVHNLFGLSETVVTNVALKSVRAGRRPFIISRSTFPGQGHFGGHWTGDIASDWTAMRSSIAGVLNFNMLGIPLVGADICGFNGNTTASLCQRWMELGAFYPFARNHNTLEAFDQDPVSLGPEVVTAARQALTIRYSILPTLYTLFVHAHLKGTPVAQPLFFQFPEERTTYYLGERQFMWGDQLMIVPCLTEGETEVEAYIPHGSWYRWSTWDRLDMVEGQFVRVSAPLDTIPLFARGGSIFPMKPPASTTTASRQLPFELMVFLNAEGEARGDLFWDDGDSLDSYGASPGHTGRHNYIQFSVDKSRVLTSSVIYSGFSEELMLLAKMILVGVQAPPTQVQVNGGDATFDYDPSLQLLEIAPLQVDLLRPLQLSF